MSHSYTLIIDYQGGTYIARENGVSYKLNPTSNKKRMAVEMEIRQCSISQLKIARILVQALVDVVKEVVIGFNWLIVGWSFKAHKSKELTLLHARNTMPVVKQTLQA